jgi:hypothetical protein
MPTTWSSQFRSHLTLGGEPMYAVDFVAGAEFRNDDLKEDRYILHSHGGPTGDHHMGHAVSRVTGSGQSVSLRSWKSSAGGLRVELSGADVAQFVARAIPRGMIAQLKIGFQGMEFSEWGTVGLYQFRGLSGSRNSWSMDFNDALSALQSIPGAHLSTQFMKEAGSTTTLTGDWSLGIDDMDVVSTANFEKDSGAAARGVIYCEPSYADAVPFYMKYESKTSTKIDDIVHVDVFGTTRPAGTPLETGDTITSIGYVNAIVPDIMHMMLFGGLAGASTMPANWNMGINFHGADTVHSSDLNEWRARWLLYTGFESEFLTDAPLENPYRGLEDFLSKFGSWLVIKEGRLSWRFVQAIVPYGDHGAYSISETHEITDQDIAGEETYDLYHSDCPVEYYSVRYAGRLTYWYDSPSGTGTGTDPAAFRLDHESSTAVYDEGTATTNRDNASANIRQRLTPWYTRIPDSMKLVLAGWKFADLVPGDVVSLKSDYIYNMVNGMTVGFLGGGTSGTRTHDGTLYMVTAVNVDWDGFTVNVELSTPPYSKTRF